MTSRGKRLSQHNSIICPWGSRTCASCYGALNFVLNLFLCEEDIQLKKLSGCDFGVWICCWEEGEAGCSSTTPLDCVNEKERGQEESAGSTTEVLTERIEGLRLHLFRPSTLPAGPRWSLCLLLASVMGARASPALTPPLLCL